MKPRALLAILLFAYTHVLSQQNLPYVKAEPVENRNPDALRGKFSTYRIVRLPSGDLSAYLHGKTSAGFQLRLTDSLNFAVQLTPATIVASNYKLRLQTPDGTKTLDSSPAYFYKGKTQDTNEEVRLAIKEGFIYGYLTKGGDAYFIEPLKRFDARAAGDEFIVYKAGDVSDFRLSCGVTDTESTRRRITEQKNSRVLRGQNDVCRKIKFATLVDYSVYQKFGNAREAEAFVLGNLNLAEGAFQTLNLQTNGDDVAGDGLLFEEESLTLSTCVTCDPVNPTATNVNDIMLEFDVWNRKDAINTGTKIYQLYTTRDMYLPSGQYAAGYSGGGADGTCGIGSQLLHYGTTDAASLRVLVAHETGHDLGCVHDNQVKGDVTRYIMYSSATGANTTFSTLSNFGGLNYSSHLAMDNLLKTPAVTACLSTCQRNPCPKISGLEITRLDDSSVQLSWSATGPFLAKYKLRDSSFYPAENVRTVNDNRIKLTSLQPCGFYTFQVQSVCNATTLSQATALTFSASPVRFTTAPTHVRNEWYDLEINFSCTNCEPARYRITLDSLVYPVAVKSGANKFVLNNLFADGARHQVFLHKESANNGCNAYSSYAAPYYRTGSQPLLRASFDSCALPFGWKDSVLNNVVPNTANPFWFAGRQNFYNRLAVSGSLDGTCMIYYNNLSNAYRGSLALTSPGVNAVAYEKLLLHFDYNFKGYKFPNTQKPAALSADVFTGTQWKTIWTVTDSTPLPRGLSSVDVWNPAPTRVFIPLDNYKNENLKVRFMVDDGSVAGATSTWLFAALDNVAIDGYAKNEPVISTDVVLFPNPARDEVFVRFARPPVGTVNYRLLDATGRSVASGEALRNWIPLQRLPAGTYVLQVTSAHYTAAQKIILY